MRVQACVSSGLSSAVAQLLHTHPYAAAHRTIELCIGCVSGGRVDGVNDAPRMIACNRPAAMLHADVCIAFRVMHGHKHWQAHTPCHVTSTHPHAFSALAACGGPGAVPPRVTTACRRGRSKGGWRQHEHTAVGERDAGGGEQSGGLGGVQHAPAEREGRQHHEHRHTESPLQLVRASVQLHTHRQRPADRRSAASAKATL
jgi:hypothetical protein